MAMAMASASAARTTFLDGGGSSSFTQKLAFHENGLGLSAPRRGEGGMNRIVHCRLRSLRPKTQWPIIPEQHKWMYEDKPELQKAIWHKSYYPKEADHPNVSKKWYIVDATNMRLGRLASTIAYYLRGKDSPMFTPSLDMGSYMIVVNSEKVGVTGRKRTDKLYRRHSGRPGGLKEETFDHLQKRIPERIVEHAVRGMLPKNRLGRAMFRKLKVFKGGDHPHGAQKPEPLPIKDKRIMLDMEPQF
ncbi:uncharacterized protein LOC9645374 [Selaginella moellendorffii]|nr:uncharacterized protein LOC9645374 [Selaginella moellendorffii]|eukprot:XP_002969747.2 uncharacterized protein LOC9645374 [Selaginella moellendorffii]